MVSGKELAGIYAALITPMQEDGSINYQVIPTLIEYELSLGVEGFYCCGSSGEALLLTLQERMDFLDAVLKAVNGRVPVISHVGTIRTTDVIQLARHAKTAGASAVSMIPPYYYHFNADEIIGYYEDVIHAVPDIGIVLYNIPQFTGISFTKDNVARLFAHPSIIGIKHTSQDLYTLERMREAYPQKVFFSGFDEMYLPSLAAGANAAIGTTVNLYAPLFLQVRQAYYEGDLALAQKFQHQINANIEAYCKAGIFNAVKYAFAKRGINCGICRAPFRPLTPAQQAEFDRYLLSQSN